MAEPEEPYIKALIKNFPFYPGLNNLIFDGIKSEVCKWPEKKKYCSIIFEKIELQPNVHYDSKLDQIIGYVSLPETKKAVFADHALVFMLHGAVVRWGQHIAVYFCQRSIPKNQLKLAIEEVVKAVVDSGLLPIALVTTPSVSFQAALKDMQKEHKKIQMVDKNSRTLKGLCEKCYDYSVNINGTVLNIIYDGRHLLKGVRNNFAKKNMMLFGKKLAQWKDIVQIYEVERNIYKDRMNKDSISFCRGGFLWRLEDDDIMPDKINKGKVENCLYIFSMTVVALLYYTGKFKKDFQSMTAMNTCEVIKFFDKLFDSVNGQRLRPFKSRSTGRVKKLRTAITKTSSHKAFWNKAIGRLKTIKFVDEQGKKTSAKTFKNWIITIKSLQSISSKMRKRKITAVMPRYFTTDTVEDLFKKIKAYNSKKEFTCYNFLKAFKTLLVIEHTSEESGSEDSDTDDTFKSFENYMRNNIPNYDNIDIFSMF